MSKEIIENMEILLAAIKAQPEDNFDLSYFKKETENVCGTLYCSAGLACTLPHFQAKGWKLVHDVDSGWWDVHINNNDFPVAFDEDFGDEAFDYLFAPSGCGEVDELHPAYIDTFDDMRTSDKELAIWRLERRIEEYKEKLNGQF